MNPSLIAIMHRQAGVFTAEHAEQAGLSRDDLRSRLRRHEVVRVRRDVYTTTALWEAGPSGVELVSADRCKRTYRAGLSVRPARLPEDHVAHRDGHCAGLARG